MDDDLDSLYAAHRKRFRVEFNSLNAFERMDNVLIVK